MQLLGLASTFDIDAEMVVTAHPLKHITFCLSVSSTVAYTSVLFCALTNQNVLFFVVFVEFRTVRSLLVLVRPMTAKARTDFEASVVSNIN